MKKTAVLLSVVFMTSIAAAQGASVNLEAEVVNSEPVPLQAGEYADLWIRVTNTGDATARNAEIQMVEEFPFLLDDRKQNWSLGELKPGERYTLRAQVRVSENAVFGENDLKIRKTGDGDTWITQKIPLEVRTDERSLVVNELDFPERVEPGSSANMTIQLKNLANSNFRNIDVTLDVTEIPVAPRETSRERITSIGPGEIKEAKFTLDVDPDADNKLHNLPIGIDYQDQAGNELSVDETTGVNIGGYSEIDVAVEESDIRSAGTGSVVFRVVNRGEGEARFAEIQLEETEQFQVLSENSIYLGSMIADGYQTAEFDLYVEEGDNLEMPVTMKYKDGEGEHEERFNIQRELYTSAEMQKYSSKTGRGPIVPLLILVVLIGGGAFVYRRRKRE